MEPSIVERIDEDLDLHAKKKKLLRLVDAQFLAGQTPDLPKLQLQLRELKLAEIELETGRPRTEAYIVYLFLMLRGWAGGCKDQQARLLLEESITLKLWLEHLGLQLPPASTLNAVSNQTRRLIHQAQLRYILQQSLDDFQKCFIDSTAVEANTERPTDSTILIRLISRICTTGANLQTAQIIISEVGLDMSPWNTEKQFSSFLGLCPNNLITGGKIIRRSTRKVYNRAADALRLCAQSLTHSKSALGAKYRRLRARLGAPKAIVAMAHHLARLVYRMLRYGQNYVEKGIHQYELKFRLQRIKWLKKEARSLNMQLVTAQ